MASTVILQQPLDSLLDFIYIFIPVPGCVSLEFLSSKTHTRGPQLSPRLPWETVTKIKYVITFVVELSRFLDSVEIKAVENGLKTYGNGGTLIMLKQIYYKIVFMKL